MVRKSVLARFLVSLVIILVTTAAAVTPAYAWKVKTHVFSANLILDEIKANNGYVEIKPYGKFQVIPEYRQAIETYPEYFRAGAMGPDLIPDILIGQTVIHPGTDTFTSGEIIEILWNKMESLHDYSTGPVRDPATPYLRLDNKQQALAFMLGCIAHVSGDYFGHSYINNWAGGSWPKISANMTNEDMKIIIRHNVVEAYIDNNIPERYKTDACNTIKIPQKFVFDNMVVDGNVDIEHMAQDDRSFSDAYGGPESMPAHFKVFFDIRKALHDRVVQIDQNMGGNLLQIGQSVMSLEFAQREYMKAWIKDIDAGLGAWVAANEEAAQAMIREDGGMTAYKDVLAEWADEHLEKMLGVPDVAVDIENAIGNTLEFAEGLIPEWLTDKIDKMKSSFVNSLLKWAFNQDLDQLTDINESPESYFNRSDLFGNDALTKMNSDMGNFSTCTSATDETFIPFENTLVMMKLNLIGLPGIAELRRVAGSTSTQTLSVSDTTLITFVNSLDVGYGWTDTNQQLPGFLLWNCHEDISKISKVIFSLNGTTQKPALYDMTQGPITIVPGPRPADSVPNINVKYRNVPNQASVKIGLYPEGDFDAQPESWKRLNYSTSGEYSVSVPARGGRFQFRIYDNNNLLLAVSDTVVINERQENEAYFMLEFPAAPLTVNKSLDYEFRNPQRKNGFFAIYREDETDPQKMAPGTKTIIRNGGSYSGNKIMPGQAGRYQFRAYDENMVLYAQSEAFNVVDLNGNAVPDENSNTDTGGTGQTQPTGSLTAPVLRASKGAGYVKLDWSSVLVNKNVAGYYVFRSANPKGYTNTPETDFWITGNTYTDTKVKAGTKYYYIVKPVYKDKTLGTASNEVSAAPDGGSCNIELTIGNPKMKVNGVLKEIDPGKGTAPEIKDGRTVLPIRAVIEEMGGTLGWDGKEKKLTLKWNENTIEMWIGKTGIKVNGTNKTMDVAPYISSTGRTMIPLRFVTENLGCVMSWDGAAKTVVIVYELKDGSTGGDSQNPDASADGENSSAAQQPNLSWDGTWNSQWGYIRFIQQGNSVSGTYGDENYPISGTVTGNTFSGRFDEGVGHEGSVEFVMSADGNTLVGRWRYDGAEEWSNWDAEREPQSDQQ